MVEVERWWFRMHAAGQDLPFVYDPDWEGLDFEALEDADARADLETYIKECEASRAATAGHSLDETVASRRGDSGQVRDIRWIYVHMIEEYARHNGHADLLREAIDGATGD